MQKTAKKHKISAGEPILALTQPVNTGIINIIRASGKDIIQLVRPFIKNASFRKNSVKSRRIYSGCFQNPSNGESIDEVIVLVFSSPRSYTREDMIELHVHQNRFSINEIINLLMEAGIRYAKPGEFTKRALLNGRIDLIQAESLDEYLKTGSFLLSKNSLRLMKGELKCFLETLKDTLIKYLALCEANIDFSEEDIELVDYNELSRSLCDLKSRIEEITAASKNISRVDDNLVLSIAGKTNAGKSSLFNALCRKDRSIVSPFPGTTRDYISEILLVDNFSIEIIDTAGIRKSTSKIEKQGIAHTCRNLSGSNMVFLIFDLSRDFDESDMEIINIAKASHADISVVYNKTDRKQRLDCSLVERNLSPDRIFRVSAKTGEGISRIHEFLRGYTAGLLPANNAIFLTNRRQIENLSSIGRELDDAVSLISRGSLQDELLAFHLKESLACIYDLFGEDLNSDILDNIFSRFCIGK